MCAFRWTTTPPSVGSGAGGGPEELLWFGGVVERTLGGDALFAVGHLGAVAGESTQVADVVLAKLCGGGWSGSRRQHGVSAVEPIRGATPSPVQRTGGQFLIDYCWTKLESSPVDSGPPSDHWVRVRPRRGTTRSAVGYIGAVPRDANRQHSLHGQAARIATRLDPEGNSGRLDFC